LLATRAMFRGESAESNTGRGRARARERERARARARERESERERARARAWGGGGGGVGGGEGRERESERVADKSGYGPYKRPSALSLSTLPVHIFTFSKVVSPHVCAYQITLEKTFENFSLGPRMRR
jgi:hypothetical protein